MSVQINEPTTTREGVDIVSQFVRLEPTLCLCGTKIAVESSYYASDAAFDAGCSTIKTNRKDVFDYDRAVDGPDLLQVSHDKWIERMTTSQGVDKDGNPLPSVHAPENVTQIDLI